MVPEEIAELAQKCFQSAPALVLGSGASLPYGIPGMREITPHLLKTVCPDGGGESDAWLLVRTALSHGDHLEQAFSEVTLPESLIRKIVEATWDLIAEADIRMLFDVLMDSQKLPLTRLFRALFQSVHREIHVITTNYDRLVEYAADAGEFYHSTGFAPGYLRHREKGGQSTLVRGGQTVRTVRVWKVHGSLDWFELPDRTIVSIPAFETRPDGVTSVIITPGVQKYQKTHYEPFRTVIAGADRALEQANGYLCIGFGFRDEHIEPKLVERCRSGNVPVVVLARSLTDEAKAFLDQRGGTNYLAFEKNDSGTTAYTSANPTGARIPGKSYWSLEQFLELVI